MQTLAAGAATEATADAARAALDIAPSQVRNGETAGWKGDVPDSCVFSDTMRGLRSLRI